MDKLNRKQRRALERQFKKNHQVEVHGAIKVSTQYRVLDKHGNIKQEVTRDGVHTG